MAHASATLRSHKTSPSLSKTSDNPTNVDDLTTIRSRTEPIGNETQRERSGLHRRIHSNSVRARDKIASQAHNYRQHARDTVQSAIELKPPISFDHLLRREKRGHPASARGSTLRDDLDQRVADDAAEQSDQKQGHRPHLTAKDYARIREANIKQENELRESLKSVEETAMNSTRELDETYYSILEKAAQLRSTVVSLQRLLEDCRAAQSTFREESSTVEQEIEQTIASFNNFDDQERAISGLISRLKSSKAKKEELSQRLEEARQRVEAFERLSQAKSKTRRNQWRIAWAVVVTIAVLLLAAIIAKNRTHIGSRVDTASRVLGQIRDDITSPVEKALKSAASQSKDPYLEQLFDKL